MTQVALADQVLRRIADTEAHLQALEDRLRRSEGEAGRLERRSCCDPEVDNAELTGWLQNAELVISNIEKDVREINAVALPAVQKRCLIEINKLQENVSRLQHRVSALPEMVANRDAIRSLVNRFCRRDEKQWPDLSERLVTVMEQQPELPFQLFLEAYQCKRRIEQAFAEAELEREYDRAFTNFFTALADAERDEENGRESMQKMVHGLPEGIKTVIYQKISEADGELEDITCYGEKHVADDLARLKEIVSVVQRELLDDGYSSSCDATDSVSWCGEPCSAAHRELIDENEGGYLYLHSLREQREEEEKAVRPEIPRLQLPTDGSTSTPRSRLTQEALRQLERQQA